MSLQRALLPLCLLAALPALADARGFDVRDMVDVLHAYKRRIIRQRARHRTRLDFRDKVLQRADIHEQTG